MTDQPTHPAADPCGAPPAYPLPYAVPLQSERPWDPMTRGDVACLTLQIVGAYTIVQSLPFLSSLYGYFTKDPQYDFRLSLPFFCELVLGATLIAGSRRLSRWLLPRNAIVVAEPISHAPAQMQAIAFSVVGLLLIGFSMPWLVYYAMRTIFVGTRGGIQLAAGERLQALIPSLLHYGSELGLGIYLFLGSRQLSAWWWKFRHPELSHLDSAHSTTLQEKPPAPPSTVQ